MGRMKEIHLIIKEKQPLFLYIKALTKESDENVEILIKKFKNDYNKNKLKKKRKILFNNIKEIK